MATILFAYATRHGQTRAIVDALADVATGIGHEATIRDLAAEGPGDAPDADLVVVAGGVYSNQFDGAVSTFLTTHADALADARTALVAVSLAAALEGEAGEQMCIDYVDELERLTGFSPGQVAMVAGALNESEYDPATRALLRVATWRRGLGATGDVSFTDFDALKAQGEAWFSGL